MRFAAAGRWARSQSQLAAPKRHAAGPEALKYSPEASTVCPERRGLRRRVLA